MKKLLTILAVLAVGLLVYPPAKEAYSQNMTASRTDSWTVTCATSATAIHTGANGTPVGFMCEESGTTAAFIGGADVTTADGFGICDTNCATKTYSTIAETGYCIVASGTVAINCSAPVR